MDRPETADPSLAAFAPGLVHTPEIPPSAWVHPSATVIGHVVLGRDVSVWPGAVLRADRATITIGDETNIQDGAVLHGDPGKPCRLGARVTVGHRAVVHGCTVEDGALIGIGAIVLNEAVVGAGAVVAAGAVVTERMVIPPGVLVAGVPAKVIRPLTDDQRARAGSACAVYVALKEHYRSL